MTAIQPSQGERGFEDVSETSFPAPQPMIDVRESVRRVWRRRFPLFAITAVLGLVGFALGMLLPAQYTATASVLWVPPLIQPRLGEHMAIALKPPARSTLLDVADADPVIRAVLENAVARGVVPAGTEPAALQRGLKLWLSDVGAIRLSVEMGDPATAAAICNLWAEEIAGQLNRLFGFGSGLERAKSDLSQARQQWQAAEEALGVYLAESQMPTLQIHLAEAHESLAEHLREIRRLGRLVSEANSLQHRLVLVEQQAVAKGESGRVIGVGNALALIRLQSAVADVDVDRVGTSYELKSEAIMGANVPVEAAREAAGRLAEAFNEQRNKTLADSAALEKELMQLALKLKAVEIRETELKRDRDLAQDAHAFLAVQVRQWELLLAQGNAAQVGMPAVVPETPSSPNVAGMTGAWALTGFVLTLLGGMVRDWWRLDVRLDHQDA